MVADRARLGLTVVGGYLGAGKTTLVNAVLGAADRRVAVLVNDFGSVDVDADLVVTHDGATLTLANGCVCCSLADGFLAALSDVRAITPPVDHVLVEASGVADPGRVAQWGHSPGFALDGVVVLVDAETVRARADDRYVGDTVRAQVAAADLVLVTRTDRVDHATASAVRAWIASLTDAPTLDAPFGAVPPDVLFGAADPQRERPPPGGPAPHPAYVTAAAADPGPTTRKALDAALAAAPAGLLRAKGFVTLADGTYVVQVVGRRREVRPVGPGVPPGSRLVAIGVAPATAADLDAWLTRLAPPTPD